MVSRRNLMGMAAAILLLAGCAHVMAPEPDRTIYLVRHAEKLAGDDPSLTPEGAARAELLAETLGDAGIVRIYSTDYARTRGTAAPLAAARNHQTISSAEINIALPVIRVRIDCCVRLNPITSRVKF